jgi:hypothetical protein
MATGRTAMETHPGAAAAGELLALWDAVRELLAEPPRRRPRGVALRERSALVIGVPAG